MNILLSNQDLYSLLQHQLGNRARVRSVLCAEDEIVIRLSLGPVPISARLGGFRLNGPRLRLRIAGGLVSKVLALVGKALERSGVEVEGEEIRVTLPDKLTRVVRVTSVRVDPQGVHLAGDIQDLSGLGAVPPPVI